MGVYVTLYVLDREAYNARLLPAYQSFFQSGNLDPILGLIAQAKAEPPESQDDWDLPALEECREILDRFAHGGPSNLHTSVDWGSGLRRSLDEIVRVNVSPILMRFLCFVRRNNRIVEQDVWKTPFMPYLYQHSEWLESFFTFCFGMEGGQLEIPWGECTELLSTSQAAQLLDETLKIPAPDDKSIQWQLKNLAELVRLALSDPKLSVAIAVS